MRKCVAFFSKRKSSAVALTGEEEPRLNLKELELEPQIVQKSSTLPDATWPEQDLVGRQAVHSQADDSQGMTHHAA